MSEKTKGKGQRGRIAKGQELEVRHLTETTNLSARQAEALLRRHGADWHKLKEEAEKLEPDG